MGQRAEGEESNSTSIILVGEEEVIFFSLSIWYDWSIIQLLKPIMKIIEKLKPSESKGEECHVAPGFLYRNIAPYF